MEIAFLFILLVVVIFMLPIAAFSRSATAVRRVEELSARLDPLEAEIYSLRRELSQRGKTVPTPRPAPESAETSEEPTPTPAAEIRSRLKLREVERPAPKPVVPVDPPAAEPVPPPLPNPVYSNPEPEQEYVESSFEEQSDSSEGINWEQFMGVRLFAWLGGLALFLAAGFLMKYSFDHGLISPAMRVTLGFVTGLGLVGGGMWMSRKKYKITADTLCATGVVILYAVTFSCRSVYHFPAFQPIPTFVLMTVITAGAFLLAVRFNARVVAVLGMLGGFLTPILVSTGQDNPFGLFTYIALLDIGLIAVAYMRRWDWLTFAAAICTALMQMLWVINFFEPEKVFTAMTIFLGFCGLFLGANLWSQRRGSQNVWLDVATIILPAATFLFVPALMVDSQLAARPGVLYSFLLGADLALIGLAITRPNLRVVMQLSGGIVFLYLAAWTVARVNDSLLFWALGGYLAFALLHTLLPIWLQQRESEPPRNSWTQIFPVATLLMTIIPLLKIDAASGLVWPFILIVNALAIVLAVLSASLSAIFLVMIVTVGVAFLWMMASPADLPGTLVVLGGIAAVFTTAGVVGGRKILERQKELGLDSELSFLPAGWSPEKLQQQLPAFAGILPFLLLVAVTARLDQLSPTPVFAFALGLGGLLLGLTRVYKLDWLPAVGLGCTFLLEHAWHLKHFNPDNSGAALGWYLLFCAVYMVFPFVLLHGRYEQKVSWATAALSGPVHFLLVLNIVQRTGGSDYPGLVPALFAVPTGLGLAWLISVVPLDHPKRNTVLAWFGGVTLLFVTLIFPLQFERQWLTISWALEGAALIWLFRHVPHHGLRYTGLILLTVAFVRLALNISVLDYSPRSEVAIFNWYLYSYGLVIAALFAAAKLLKKPDHLVFQRDVRPWLVSMGTSLAFLLVNIEITDFFSKPGEPKLAFKFSGNFGRDMTYTIAWALFAFVLMLIGILKRVRPARWAAIGLLGVTLLKLFFHDLAALNQLYRVGALVGVAVIAIVVSFLYQKFLREQVNAEK